MARTLWYVGGEDMDLNGYNNAYVDTTSPRFRSNMARCALSADDSFSGWDTGTAMGNKATAWFHTRIWALGQVYNIDFGYLEGDGREYRRSCIRFVDEHGTTRLMIGYTTYANWASYDPLNLAYTQWWFAKVDDLGEVTRIGPIFSTWITASPAVPEAVDVAIMDYDVTDGGSVKVYVNNVLVYAVDGVTLHTNGNDGIAGWRLSGLGDLGGVDRMTIGYSEVVIGAEDTRNLNVATLVPDEDGFLTNWTTGGADNVNELVLNDGTGNTSDTPGQIQQYTIQTPPVGDWGVVAIVVAARAQQGNLAGPTQIELGVRSFTSDEWGAPQALPITLQRVQLIMDTNSATGVGFTMAELNDTSFNLGMQSIA